MAKNKHVSMKPKYVKPCIDKYKQVMTHH